MRAIKGVSPALRQLPKSRTDPFYSDLRLFQPRGAILEPGDIRVVGRLSHDVADIDIPAHWWRRARVTPFAGFAVAVFGAGFLVACAKPAVLNNTLHAIINAVRSIRLVFMTSLREDHKR